MHGMKDSDDGRFLPEEECLDYGTFQDILDVAIGDQNICLHFHIIESVVREATFLASGDCFFYCLI